MTEKKTKKEKEVPKEKPPKVYTIPLRDAFSAPKKKRASKAVLVIKKYLKRHVKSDDVKISAKLNEALWSRGIEKPPRSIKVKVAEEEGVLTADTVE